jgi:ADP-heptose:LPS heptosyltransferase
MSSRRSAAPIVRVLIIKRDKLGDLLLTRPVITRLAAAVPQAEIHLLANDYNAWVASDHPALARTWIYPRVRNDGRVHAGAALAQIPLGWRLVRARFDAALVMGGDESHRAIRRALATRATRVVAYASEPARYGRRLTDPLPPPRDGHEVARMLALLAPLGVAPSAVEAPTFTPPADALAFAATWLPARGLAAGQYVVIGLGARKAKKQPTAEQVARWATRIFAEHGLAAVLMWTPGTASNAGYPGDDALAQAIVDRGLAHVHPFRGPIREALGLISSARTSVMPDSGLMHFAAASAGGVLGLFADPLDSAPAARWAPLGPRARHLEAPRRVSELADADVFRVLDPLLLEETGSEP